MESVKRLNRLKNLSFLIDQFRQNIKYNNINLPKFVKIVEVGPRDGLQNEKTIVPTNDKIYLIKRLSEIGFKTIECTSFVSPKWVPQMADNQEVFKALDLSNGISYPVLVPNLKGLESALKVGVKEIAIFGAASESFSQKNINCSIEESLERFKQVIDEALKNNIRVRGYISCVMGCPYEGEVDPNKVRQIADKMYDMGCYEISLGDTIGVGTPEKTEKLLNSMQNFPIDKLAVHFHDTYDKAIENILVALTRGISIVDSSIGGLGGCPYAKKSAGNVCTENVIYTLQELGIFTGIDLNQAQKVGNYITGLLGRENMSVLE